MGMLQGPLLVHFSGSELIVFLRCCRFLPIAAGFGNVTNIGGIPGEINQGESKGACLASVAVISNHSAGLLVITATTETDLHHTLLCNAIQFYFLLAAKCSYGT
jgi:hypothetical protein